MPWSLPWFIGEAIGFDVISVVDMVCIDIAEAEGIDKASANISSKAEVIDGLDRLGGLGSIGCVAFVAFGIGVGLLGLCPLT